MVADVRDDARTSRDFHIACASYAQLLETIRLLGILIGVEVPSIFKNLILPLILHRRP